MPGSIIKDILHKMTDNVKKNAINSAKQKTQRKTEKQKNRLNAVRQDVKLIKRTFVRKACGD